ncbi:uncharacterized protein METZ01_LOCUS328116, partial [marine metagenome]
MPWKYLMKLSLKLLPALILLSFVPAAAQQHENYDYFSANRQLVRNGVQAVLMCNGLFTSNRSLQEVFHYELAYLKSERFGGAVGTIDGGDWLIDHTLKAVAIGGANSGPVIRAAFREGIGCVVMPPDQTFEDINKLPQLTLPYPDDDPEEVAWPNGDLIPEKALPTHINKQALQAASDWAF